MSKIISYADRVLVDLTPDESDMFLSKKHLEGVVVSCGTSSNSDIDVKEGDKVLIDKNAIPYETIYDGKTLYFFRKINILAIIKD